MADKKTKPLASTRRPRRTGKTSKPTERVSTNLRAQLSRTAPSAKALKTVAYFAAAVLIGVGLWLFFDKFIANPNRVFWGMINNNLSTVGVSRQTTQPSCLLIKADMENTIEFNFDNDIKVHCLTRIANGATKLDIESIGTSRDDYQRYVHLETTGKKQDFSKVYQIWIRINKDDKSQPHLFTQLLTDPVLFGNLSPKARAQVSDKLKQAYLMDPTSITKTFEGVRPVISYTVAINLRKFAEAEKIYADQLGLADALRINPQSYPAGRSVLVNFKVDVLSRELRQIMFNEFTEKYSGYGVQHDIQLPNHISSQAELQKAFREAAK